jgi:hypothetical protein
MCSLHFENNLLSIEGIRDIEENTIIKAFVRFHFASVAITSCDNVVSVTEKRSTAKEQGLPETPPHPKKPRSFL